MRNLFYILPIITLLIFSNCNKGDDYLIQTQEITDNSKNCTLKTSNNDYTIEKSEKEPIEPTFQTSIPEFPLIALHILQREYSFYKNKDYLKITEGEYLEKRLIELYPKIAFKGMYKQATKEMKDNLTRYNKYLEELESYERAIGRVKTYDDYYQKFTTLQDEIEYMKMTQSEIDEFNKYEKIATSGRPISRKELNKLLNGQINNRSGVLLYAAMGTAAVLTGYSAWRVLQSRDRAEDKTDEFYAGQSNSGEIGDAFRHIYVSVLLRRYLTIVGAWAVMSSYEIIHPNDHARDTYMDYHNNAVGRYYEYWTFRGHYIWDRYKWEKWANSAKYWVDNSSNGVDMEDKYGWLSDDPDAETAENDENNIDNHKYIHYAH